MKVCFLIRSLNRGGTERQLITLLNALPPLIERHVITYYPGGVLENEISKDVFIHSLDAQGRHDAFSSYLRLRRLLEKQKPDVVYSFLPSANIFSALVLGLGPRIPLIWGMRTSNARLGHFDRYTRLQYWAQKHLSFIATKIIFNSYAGMNEALASGFSKNRCLVVPNGIDTQRFIPNKNSRQAIRDEWQISHETILVGLVTRPDPLKDHDTFVALARRFQSTHKNVQFVAIGTTGIGAPVLSFGPQKDIQRFYSALDILVSTSVTEGFSNTLAEAMACGTTCVSTDVGDAQRILGETGTVVPLGDIAAFARGLERQIDRVKTERDNLSQQARRRIKDHFGVELLIERTLKVFQTCSPSSPTAPAMGLGAETP